MLYLPILVLHICAGTVGLLSGTAAMFFRKGSLRHVQAGKVFVASMLIMGVGAVYLGIVKNQPSNIVRRNHNFLPDWEGVADREAQRG
jgi:hypothetical protein